MLLPPEAVQLLTIMFPRGVVCQRSLVDLAAEVSDTPRAVDRLLRFLTAIGLLSTEHSARRVASTYRLTLRPRAAAGNRAGLEAHAEVGAAAIEASMIRQRQ
jgi:hypothetical protein